MRTIPVGGDPAQTNGGDEMTLETGFQEASGARQSDAADRPAPFRFAPTFKIDLAFSVVYVALFIWTWAHGAHKPWHCAIAGLFGFLLVLCYAGKVAIIGFLNQRGGDARTYVISSGLVTTGLYAYSRNPTYLLTLIQCVVWSALIVFLQLVGPLEPVVMALAALLPLAFFLLHDLLIIAREDAALSAAHPEAFAAYSKSVGRWFGRKRGGETG
jgi:protein-S-isoprenylcysteine O-methyltransferase Ste14